MTAELARIHLTVPKRLLQKLAAARDALSHSNPGASDDEILELGLDLVVERHRKRRGIRPRPAGSPSADVLIDRSGRSIPGPASALPVTTAA